MASKKKGKEIFKKVFIILSGLAFVLFSVSAVVNMIINPQTPVSTDNQNPQDDGVAISQIEREIAGYESVLENEPENRFALERLVELNLQKGDLQGALTPMKKLVAIQPEEERYQEVLGIIKQGLEEQENPPTELETNPETTPETE
ncbi:MAG: tetratricopeptide repeat protein [Cyanobacterium sp.]